MNEAALEITMKTRLMVNPNLVLREEGDDGALLYDPDSGAVRILNLTAVAIWKLLETGRSVSELIALLKEQFEGLDAEADQQVLATVRQLQRLGALSTAERLS